MNVGKLVSAQFARIPGGVKGTVTFTHPRTGAETTAQAVARPARGTAADGFAAGTEIRKKYLVLWVLPDGLAFAPRPGLRALWQDETFEVVSAPATQPGGTVLGYEVTLSRPGL